MASKYLLWDQDNFVLRGYYEHPSKIKLNPTVRSVLTELRDRGYINLTLSNKSAIISREKARIVGIEDLFDDFFDGRDVPNFKSTAPIREKYNLSIKQLANHALYLGDSFNEDIIYDIPSMVHIFDAHGYEHDFHIFHQIIDLLNQKDSSSFKKAYELLEADNKDKHDKTSIPGITFSNKTYNLQEFLLQRNSLSKYQDKNIQGESHVVTVKKATKRFQLKI